MSRAQTLITENIATWTGAIQAKSTAGRGSSNKYELYGIKKLRELILELAVRGKLVPQDSSDEPASVLLERIAAEKAELVKAKKLKKTKALPPVSDEDKPFEVPEGWEWTRLSNVYDVRDGTHDSPKYQTSGYPLVTSKNLATGSLTLTDVKYISEEDHKKISERSAVDRGDILFAMIGTIGNPVIVDIEEEFSIKNVALFKPTSRALNNMNFLCIQLLVISEYLKNNAAGGVQKFTSLGMLRNQVVSLPPLAEQQRIVQKVDELMALCDQLEQQTESSIQAHATLVDTLLSTLTNSADADELQQNWGRIAGHFDTLFTTEQSIDALKQTILQLAVMGKLVRQNPEDEPASVLLKRIAAEKDRLVKEKKIKKQKPLPEINEDEKPFELPEGWEWCRLRDLGITATGKTPSTAKPDFFNGNIPFIGPGQITADGKVLPAEKFLSEKGSKESTEALYGDILTVCIGGSIGKSAIAPHRLTFNQQINAVHPIIMNSKFTFYSLVAQSFIDSILSSATGSATPIINRSKWENLPVSVPPVEEQHRIVVKVDELMAICDQLKDKLQQSQQTQVHLTDAIVEQALV